MVEIKQTDNVIALPVTNLLFSDLSALSLSWSELEVTVYPPESNQSEGSELGLDLTLSSKHTSDVIKHTQ